MCSPDECKSNIYCHCCVVIDYWGKYQSTQLATVTVGPVIAHRLTLGQGVVTAVLDLFNISQSHSISVNERNILAFLT